METGPVKTFHIFFVSHGIIAEDLLDQQQWLPFSSK